LGVLSFPYTTLFRSSGKCYDFVSEAEFDAMVARGEFLEYARVFGRHSYGTPRKWLEESRKRGLDLVLEIDVQGAAQVKSSFARRSEEHTSELQSHLN